MRDLLANATATLAHTGVASPRHDAHALAAHLLNVEPLQLPFLNLTDLPDQHAFRRSYAELIARRAAREPLQHIVGTAAFGPLMLRVGPGVFIPRPETEWLADWVVTALAGTPQPIVVDLCAGSGAIAGFIAQACPDATVYAVELSPAALEYTHANVDPLGVKVVAGDATDLGVLPQVQGQVHAVVTNPPYVPQSDELQPEVYADPDMAVFAGADGLDLIPGLLPVAQRLLRPGGIFACEHDDSHAVGVEKLLHVAGFREVRGHRDLTGRPRFSTAWTELTTT